MVLTTILRANHYAATIEGHSEEGLQTRLVELEATSPSNDSYWLLKGGVQRVMAYNGLEQYSRGKKGQGRLTKIAYLSVEEDCSKIERKAGVESMKERIRLATRPRVERMIKMREIPSPNLGNPGILTNPHAGYWIRRMEIMHAIATRGFGKFSSGNDEDYVEGQCLWTLYDNLDWELFRKKEETLGFDHSMF